MEIKRGQELSRLRERLKRSPAVALLGPRQCGKTTLARQFARTLTKGKVHFFDLEKETDLARLDNPTLALQDLRGTVVIDEIQLRPNLFPALRVLIDQKAARRFLILGSASRDLIRQGSETLAGRISFMEMGGFSLQHFSNEAKKLWLRGGFPKSFLARSETDSLQWREDFVTTFLERDIPRLGMSIPPRTLKRFWMMLGHYHGQFFNASELGKSLGLDHKTCRRYLDLLSGTFMVRQLQPWFYNTKKRLVKSPKLYFRDSGIFHALLSIRSSEELHLHPRLGASWEGFALEEACLQLELQEEEVFFWKLHEGEELDLVFQRGGKLWGVEVKYREAPTLTRSMLAALEELSLAHLWVVYPGAEEYRLHEKVSVLPVSRLDTIRY